MHCDLNMERPRVRWNKQWCRKRERGNNILKKEEKTKGANGWEENNGSKMINGSAILTAKKITIFHLFFIVYISCKDVLLCVCIICILCM